MQTGKVPVIEPVAAQERTAARIKKREVTMIFYRELYANESLPARTRLVYMYLRDRANRDGLCWPAIETIARETKLSRSTV